MKKKLLCIVLVCISVLSFSFAVGCSGHQHVWDTGVITREATKTQSGEKKYHCEKCLQTKKEEVLFVAPTKAQVYTARQTVVESAYEGYNFSFDLSCNLSLLGLGAEINGSYDGQYRHNKNTGEEQFKRETSGLLFFDSTEYSYTKNSQKIKLKMNDDGTVKKSSIIRQADESSFFINKAVVSLVNAIQVSTINNVEIAPTNINFDFVAELNFGANSPKISQITSIFAKADSKVAFKEISFTNPCAIPFYFNINKENELQDFMIGLDFSIKIKGAEVAVSVSYVQEEANTEISIPQDNALIVADYQIENEINYINNSISALKNAEDYSLDVVARNEFDPAWNKLATVDQYISRMYKNTDGNDVWFNHSYEYKIHHLEDGKETYKYTLGNLEDGSVHLVSRKGKNEVGEVSGISADTQFDYLVSPFVFKANNIDCIKKTSNGNKTIYNIHVNDETAISIQNKIIEMINSINEDKVADVNNYMNSQVKIKDAEFIVTYENGAIKDIKIKTDLKYNPTGGEYTDYNITLTNELELLVNDKLSNASDYKAPSSTGSIVGLAAAKFYIV